MASVIRFTIKFLFRQFRDIKDISPFISLSNYRCFLVTQLAVNVQVRRDVKRSNENDKSFVSLSLNISVLDW